jgi:chromosome segregation ATPase
MADLIERLTTPRRQLHRFGKMVDKSPPAIQREAADEIASLRASLSQEREAREKAERERDELRLVGTEKDLRRERDDARRQRDEIGRAWDEADARAKEAEARAASLEKALAEARAQRDYWRGRDKAGCEIEAELRAELERIASPNTIAGMHEQDRAAKLQAIAAASLSSSKQKDGGE